MRRTSVPRVRTTKPVLSPGFAPAVAVRSSAPGTVTGPVTVTWPSPSCEATVAVQSPAPPPASVSETVAEADAPLRSSPNETDVGCAKSSGSSARVEVDEPAALARRENLVAVVVERPGRPSGRAPT